MAKRTAYADGNYVSGGGLAGIGLFGSKRGMEFSDGSLR
jgi:hypothetical protein